MELHRGLRRLVVTGAGLAPGFMLPFVVAWRLDPEESDGFLFALSLSLVMINVVVVAVESHSMAVLADAGYAREASVRMYIRTIVSRACIVIILAIPTLCLVYAAREPKWLVFSLPIAVIAIAPLAAVFSGLAAGVLYARGKAELPIGSQALRSLLPALLLLLIADASPLLLAVAFAGGELIRAFVLTAAAMRLDTRSDRELRRDGLYWQMASSGLSQGNPVVDRLFLASGSPGQITAYELADKLSFAAFQLVFSGFLSPRSATWARALATSRRSGARLFWKTTLTAMLLVAIIASLLMVGIVSVGSLDITPEEWNTGLHWALWALPSVVFSIGQMASVRFIVALNAEKHLLPVTLAGFGINVGMDLLFWSVFGPIGIIIATLITRCLVTLMFFGLTAWLVRRPNRGRS